MINPLHRSPAVQSIVRSARRLEEIVVIVLCLAMTLVVLWTIFTRFVLGDPSSWGESVARLLFTWLTFLGAALVVRYRVDIRIDYFVNFLPPTLKRVSALVVRAIVVALLALLIAAGFSYVWITWPQLVGILDISYGFFALAVPVSAIVMLVHVLAGATGGPGDDQPTGPATVA